MFSRRNRFLIGKMVLVLAAILTFQAPIVRAQLVPSWATSIVLTPSINTPVPGQELTIKAESFTADLNTATITWTVGGKQYDTGVGKKEITVTAPALGKTLVVSITAITLEGQRLNSSLTLGTGEIDLIIETDGYVPPFFKGKTPLVYQNPFKVIAVPHLADANGKEYSPATLVYEWKKDYKALPSDSGYGRNTISLIGELIPRPYMLSLTVSTRDGRARAEKFISISHGEPFIVFYEDDPQYGALYNRARLNPVSLGSSKELSILAAPFGFNKSTSGTGGLSFNWSVNGEAREELASNQTITLRAPSEGGGAALIDLEIRNLKEILQGSRSGFTAQFSKSEEESNLSI